MLDETTFSDADYVYVNSDSTMEVKFASVSDPATSSGHKVRYRIKGNGVATITVSLRQGASTEIASWSHTTASTTTTAYEQTLTSGQADSITDYADLRLRFVTFTP
jgi:VanZ family protein